MRLGGRGLTTLFLLAVAAALAPAAASAADPAPQTRYSLVHNCYALQVPGGKFAAKDAAQGYTASADSATAGAEVFRMQATDLGRYMLYGRARDFMGASNGSVVVNGQPGASQAWRVDEAGDGTFKLTSEAEGKSL